MFFPVWSRARLHHDPLPFAPLLGRKIDLIRTSPAVYDRYNRPKRQAQFDTVLVSDPSREPGLHHYFAARALVIFKLPSFCHDIPSEPLVYIERFAPFSSSAPNPHQLHTTSPAFNANRQRCAEVIPLSHVRMTCHLVPKYTESTLASRNYRLSSSTDLLSSASLFFLNRHSSHYFFAIMEHWRRVKERQQMALE
ncbi:hypothetical protein BDV93DRAFT_222927 [Ceratobasidium sp. AG-I]|nr:hypothetical protein BDV93DRAFT_222927 [Ceratobasidium sp. AG-I]